VPRRQEQPKHLAATYGTYCRRQQLLLQPQRRLQLLLVVMLCWVCRVGLRGGQ
jgi:hypothetical protein